MSGHRDKVKRQLRYMAAQHGAPNHDYQDARYESVYEEQASRSFPMHLNTTYVFTDGSYRDKDDPATGGWAYKVMAWDHAQGGWKTIHEDRRIGIKHIQGNAQMEMQAIIRALTWAVEHTQGALCLRSDHLETVRIMKEYLATYRVEPDLPDEERRTLDGILSRNRHELYRKHAMGIGKINQGHRKEYHQLFAVLDRIGENALPVTMEYFKHPASTKRMQASDPAEMAAYHVHSAAKYAFPKPPFIER